LQEEHNVLGNWFRLHFVENEGMAWGWKFGGDFGKIILTLFRLIAVVFGTFYLRTIVKKKYHKGFILCAALIYTGALGNLLDSMFYGLIFSESNTYTLAKLFPAGGGYTSFSSWQSGGHVVLSYYSNKNFLHGFLFGAEKTLNFFSPVFNLADASISIGVIILLIWQKKFFPHRDSKKSAAKDIAEDNVQAL